MGTQTPFTFLKKFLILYLILFLFGASLVLGISIYVTQTTAKQILSPADAAALEDVDCILVLGCGVYANGEPSPMLEDRLKRGISLFHDGASVKLLMSGDHGQDNYDEVNAMKKYAIAQGVASSDIFMDHAGFSTYESIYRARDIFQTKKIIIVTQKYHLHRALYIAKALGIEAYGVSADYRTYSGQLSREVREVLARNKDFLTSILQPKPTYTGETIPIFGNGDLTNG